MFGLKFETANTTLLVAIVPLFTVIGRVLQYAWNCLEYGWGFDIPVEYLTPNAAFLSSFIIGLFAALITLVFAFLITSYDSIFLTEDSCSGVFKRYAHNLPAWLFVSGGMWFIILMVALLVDVFTQRVDFRGVGAFSTAISLLWAILGWITFNYEKSVQLSETHYFENKYNSFDSRMSSVFVPLFALYFLVLGIYVLCIHWSQYKYNLVLLLWMTVLLITYGCRVYCIWRRFYGKNKTTRVISIFVDRVGKHLVLFPILLLVVLAVIQGIIHMPDNKQLVQYKITPDNASAVVFCTPEYSILEEVEIDSSNSRLTIYTSHQTIVELPVEYELREFDRVTITRSLTE